MHKLTVVSNPECGGSVTYDPALCPTSTYPNNTAVTLTAVPSAGYQFERWSGDVDGVADNASSTIQVIMDKARTITVNFTAPGGLSTVTVEAIPSIGGFVRVDTCFSLTSDNTQPAISFQCARGTVVTVTAAPEEGYQFRGWKGDVVSKEEYLILTVNSDTTFTAEFAQPSRFPWGWVALGGVVALLAVALAGILLRIRTRPKPKAKPR